MVLLAIQCRQPYRHLHALGSAFVHGCLEGLAILRQRIHMGYQTIHRIGPGGQYIHGHLKSAHLAALKLPVRIDARAGEA